MRRTGKSSSANDIKEVSYDKLVVNMTKYELKVDGKVVDTPPKELELLYHLASNPNRVYTPAISCSTRFGALSTTAIPERSTCTSSACAKKLEGVSDKWSLKTVWGVGV